MNTATFGKLFSCAVDGAVYAQPLWVANLTIAGVRHNVVFVATEHDGLYAFDADASPCQLLWQAEPDRHHARGGRGGETHRAGRRQRVIWWAPATATSRPEVGVTGTPVIDPAAGILYVVSKSVDAGGTIFYQRLHAIDLASGSETRRLTGEHRARPTRSTTAASINFAPRQQNCSAPAWRWRAATIYIAWGAHEDALPWFGWLVGLHLQRRRLHADSPCSTSRPTPRRPASG